jgi:hypothetical protein
MATRPTTTKLGARWAGVKSEIHALGPRLAELILGTAEAFRAESQGQEYDDLTLYAQVGLSTMIPTSGAYLHLAKGYSPPTYRPTARLGTWQQTLRTNALIEHWPGTPADWETLADHLADLVADYEDSFYLSLLPGWEPETEADAVTSALSTVRVKT